MDSFHQLYGQPLRSVQGKNKVLKGHLECLFRWFAEYWSYELRLQILLPAVFVAFTCAANIPRVAGQTVKVFLLGGQSNMQGTRTVNFLPPPFDEPQDDVWIWQDDNTTKGWTSLRVGFAGTGSDFDRGFGPELSLGRVLADAMPDDQFAFVKHVQGGTGATMEDGWSPDRGNGQGRVLSTRTLSARRERR